jgi:hypothetical protein
MPAFTNTVEVKAGAIATVNSQHPAPQIGRAKTLVQTETPGEALVASHPAGPLLRRDHASSGAHLIGPTTGSANAA